MVTAAQKSFNVEGALQNPCCKVKRFPTRAKWYSEPLLVLSDNQLHLVSSWLGSLYLPLSYSLARASSEYSVSRGHVTCMGQQCDYQAVFNVERVSLVDG